MNSSFMFTQHAAPSNRQSVSLDLKPSTKAQVPAQAFSNVLERAVQIPSKKAPEKPKQRTLGGAHSAEHLSRRSVETPDEHKPASLTYASKRKAERDEDVTIHPVIFSGMPMPVVKQDETSPPSGTSDLVLGSPTTVENYSDQKSPVEAGADKIASTQAAHTCNPKAASVELNLESVALAEGDEVAVAENTIADLQQLEQTLDQDLKQTTKGLAPELERPIMTASTLREALRGTARGDANLSPTIETPNVTTIADAASVESVLVNPISTEELQLSGHFDQSALTEAREKSRGTAAAKLNMSMNKEAKREEIAGLTPQVLPGYEVSQVATGIKLPSEQQRTASKETTGIDSLTVAARLTTGPARTDVSLNTELLDVREASHAVRIGEVISREVRMFKRGGDDMLEVVLTPDAKTQISLKLQWRDGQVEVQARCDMGDHQLLNAQWSQLQASFAAHGVRLSHLSERAHAGFMEFFSNSGFSQQQGGERQPAPQQSAIDPMKQALPAPKTGAARSVVRSSHRLESWA